MTSNQDSETEGVSFVKRGFLDPSSHLKKKRELSPFEKIEKAWAEGTFVANWDFVPLECIAHIFSFCNLSDMPKAELVCKEWRALLSYNEVRRAFISTYSNGTFHLYGELYDPFALCKGATHFQGEAWRFLLRSKQISTPEIISSRLKMVRTIVSASNIECILNAYRDAIIYEGECVPSGTRIETGIPHGYGVCYLDTRTRVVGTWQSGRLIKGSVFDNKGTEMMRVEDILFIGCMGSFHPVIATGWCMIPYGPHREGRALFVGSWIMPYTYTMAAHSCDIYTSLNMIKGKVTMENSVEDGIFVENKLVKGTRLSKSNMEVQHVLDDERLPENQSIMNIATQEILRIARIDDGINRMRNFRVANLRELLVFVGNQARRANVPENGE